MDRLRPPSPPAEDLAGAPSGAEAPGLSWGWVDVHLRPGWYGLACTVSLAALLGLALGLRRFDGRGRAVVALAALWALSFTAAILALELRLLRSGDNQLLCGRYLAQVWLPLSLLMLLGLRALGDRLRARFDAAGIGVLLLIVLDVVSALRIAARYTAAGASSFAHAHEVFDLLVPGGFWPALCLQLLALTCAVWLTFAACGRRGPLGGSIPLARAAL